MAQFTSSYNPTLSEIRGFQDDQEGQQLSGALSLNQQLRNQDENAYGISPSVTPMHGFITPDNQLLISNHDQSNAESSQPAPPIAAQTHEDIPASPSNDGLTGRTEENVSYSKTRSGATYDGRKTLHQQ